MKKLTFGNIHWIVFEDRVGDLEASFVRLEYFFSQLICHNFFLFL